MPGTGTTLERDRLGSCNEARMSGAFPERTGARHGYETVTRAGQPLICEKRITVTVSSGVTSRL